MRILVDSDVLLDLILSREPFHEAAEKVVDWAEVNPGAAAVSWHSFSNLDYVVGDSLKIRELFTDLVGFIEVPACGTRALRKALGFRMADFEDALQAAAALEFEADYIVTRNKRDFKNSPVPACEPKTFLALIDKT